MDNPIIAGCFDMFELVHAKTGLGRYLPLAARCSLLLCLMLLAGCVVPIKYDASVPRDIPPGYAGKIKKQTISLELPELTLSAQVQAYNWNGQYLLRPLGVWLEVDASEGWFKLDPGLVRLRSDQGDNLEPVSFLGPSLPWHSPRALAAGCGPRRYHSGIAITNIGISQQSVMRADSALGIYRPSRGAVTSEGQKCFMFWFDTDPMPVHDFVLTIDGISVDGHKVAVPPILFHQGSLTTVRAIP